MAFRAERAERQAIIERSLRRSAPALPAVSAAWRPSDESPDVDVSLSGLDGEPTLFRSPGIARLLEAPWLGRIAAVGAAGLIGLAAARMLLAAFGD